MQFIFWGGQKVSSRALIKSTRRHAHEFPSTIDTYCLVATRREGKKVDRSHRNLHTGTHTRRRKKKSVSCVCWRKKNDVVPLSFSLEVCIFAERSQMLIVKLFPGMMSSLSIDTHWPIAEQMHNPLKLCSTTLLIRWCQVLSQLNYFV